MLKSTPALSSVGNLGPEVSCYSFRLKHGILTSRKLLVRDLVRLTAQDFIGGVSLNISPVWEQHGRHMMHQSVPSVNLLLRRRALCTHGCSSYDSL